MKCNRTVIVAPQRPTKGSRPKHRSMTEGRQFLHSDKVQIRTNLKAQKVAMSSLDTESTVACHSHGVFDPPLLL